MSRKKDKKYCSSKKFGNTDTLEETEKTYKKVLESICCLIEAGSKNDINEINNSLLSPMFRGKILSTYYPDRFLCIYNEEHINMFLKHLGVDKKNYNLEEKKKLLLDQKNKYNTSKGWNSFKYMRFLYWWKNPKEVESTFEETDVENYLNGTSQYEGYKFSEKLVKERKLNQKVLIELKKLYNGQCQICGKRIGNEFGDPIVEAHHIEYYSISQNNNKNNIMILCPNHHSIIHRFNPKWDNQKKCFDFGVAGKLNLAINKHL